MRLLHGSDFHIGLANYGRSVEEFGHTLSKFVTTAVEEDVDLVIISGDLFHSRRPGPQEMRIVSEAVKRLMDKGKTLVVGPGNHDGMVTIADPDTQTLGWLDVMDLPGVHVGTKPSVYSLDQAVVCVLPYAHKRAIADPTLTIRERTDESSRILGEAVGFLFEQTKMAVRRLGNPTIFVGHLSTEHASLGSEAAMQMGWDTVVDPAVFEPFDYAALGHIHIQQQVTDKAWYAGSPDVHGFGEDAGSKGFLLVDVERGKLPVVTPVHSNPRPLQTIVSWENDGWNAALGREIAVGAIVRLELHPTEKMDPRLARELVQNVRARGATYVQTVIIPPEREERQRRVSQAERPVAEQVDIWLETQDAPKKTKDRAREIAGQALAL